MKTVILMSSTLLTMMTNNNLRQTKHKKMHKKIPQMQSSLPPLAKYVNNRSAQRLLKSKNVRMSRKKNFP